MDVGRKTRKRRRLGESRQAAPAVAPRTANELPPQLIPFVDALAELLVSAYLQDDTGENTGTDTGENTGDDTEGNTGLNPRGGLL